MWACVRTGVCVVEQRVQGEKGKTVLRPCVGDKGGGPAIFRRLDRRAEVALALRSFDLKARRETKNRACLRNDFLPHPQGF